MTRALLLLGSPKLKKSSSESLGVYLLKRLERLGAVPDKQHVFTSLKTEKGRNELLTAIDAADLIIFSAPLYADSLPSHDIEAFEIILEHRSDQLYDKPQSLVAIINCGFPEPDQNEAALSNCRLFAKKAGFNWRGGFAIGMGGLISGQPLESRKVLLRPIRNAFKKAASYLIEGKPIPELILDKASNQVLPDGFYVLGGNLSWKRKAKKAGTKDELEDKPIPES